MQITYANAVQYTMKKIDIVILSFKSTYKNSQDERK